MKKNLLSLAVLALVLIPFGLSADGMGTGVVKDVNGLKVELLVGAKKAKVGANEVTVRIRDAQGMAVADAAVTLEIAMDQGSTMSMDMDKEKAKTVALGADASAPGSYKGSVDLGFKGKWTAAMELSRAGVTEKASFGFEVAEAGPNWAFLAVFAAVIAAVIAGAAFLRGRKNRNKGGKAA